MVLWKTFLIESFKEYTNMKDFEDFEVQSPHIYLKYYFLFPQNVFPQYNNLFQELI